MSEQTTTHPAPAARPPDEPEPLVGDPVGRANDIDPRAPKSLEELKEIREAGEVAEALDELGPSPAELPRPIAVIYVPISTSALGDILLRIDEHFPGCTVEFGVAEVIVRPKV